MGGWSEPGRLAPGKNVSLLRVLSPAPSHEESMLLADCSQSPTYYCDIRRSRLMTHGGHWPAVVGESTGSAASPGRILHGPRETEPLVSPHTDGLGLPGSGRGTGATRCQVSPQPRLFPCIGYIGSPTPTSAALAAQDHCHSPSHFLPDQIFSPSPPSSGRAGIRPLSKEAPFQSPDLTLIGLAWVTCPHLSQSLWEGGSVY